MRMVGPGGVSNLQPDRYERTSGSKKACKSRQIRRQLITFVLVWFTRFIGETLAALHRIDEMPPSSPD